MNKIRDKYALMVKRCSWTKRALQSQPPRIELLHARAPESPVALPEFVKSMEGPAYIEPEYGYIITAGGRLIEEAIAPQIPHKSSWRMGLPSTHSIDAMIKDPARIVYYPTVVSLRHWWEWNYYHFHLDVLGKLRLLHDIGIDDEIPIALGRYVREKSFAEQILTQGKLAKRHWIVPDIDNRTIIRADRIVYCRTQQSFMKRLSFLTEEMCAPDPVIDSSERIYLTRKPPAPRRILNEEEIECVFRRHGFHTVDTDGMAMSEQIALFSRVRYLAAIHGAGLTNIIYRRGAPLSVLEMHARNYRPPCMSDMCQEFGYDHQALDGDPEPGDPQNASFVLSPERLEAALRDMVPNRAECVR